MTEGLDGLRMCASRLLTRQVFLYPVTIWIDVRQSHPAHHPGPLRNPYYTVLSYSYGATYIALRETFLLPIAL